MTHLFIKKPVITLVIILAIIATLIPAIPKIDVDASPASLLLDSDPDLKYYRELQQRYESDEYIVVALQPNDDMYSAANIALLNELSDRFSSVEGVTTVTSIASVPLLQQRDDSDSKQLINFYNLNSDKVDIDLARNEFANSPLYTNNLVSPDAKTTAIKVDIQKNETYTALVNEKYKILEEIELQTDPSESLNNRIEEIDSALKEQRAITGATYHNVLSGIREIVSEYQDKGNFYLAGAPLLANDIKLFVRSDIKIFGIAIILIMCVVLFIFFRKLSWVLLPLTCALLNVLLVSSLVSLFGLQLTIISSNFISLLVIFSISLSIHVIIRYQEICARLPHASKDHQICEAAKQIVTPCFYMVATSAIAFFSLIVSDIEPVIHFGLIMIIGLSCAFLLTFTILPVLIKLFDPPVDTIGSEARSRLLANLLKLVMQNKAISIICIFAVFVISLIGINNITVENRFIDYFKSNTDIHQGLVAIDQELGGTVPLELILDAPKIIKEEESDFDEDDEFGDYFDQIEEDNFTQESYWYNRRGIKKIKQVHEYLEGLDQIGKVLSLSSTEQVFRQINKGEELEDFFLAVIYKKSPEDIKKVLINPYLSTEGDQARILARVKDSDRTLVRNELLDKINNDVNADFIVKGETLRLSGISVLYNNVLQSLYRSQIVTLGTVFVCILVMLIVLFRNIRLAIIGTLPNIFTALFILGSMGILGIPLDIMTITIAAITIGIGVDYAIHYIHRFKKEIANNATYEDATYTVQTTVGKALYYTSLTVTIGFVILTSSSFRPSIYFGLFTSIAMIISLLATFTIIPLLVNYLRPIKYK